MKMNHHDAPAETKHTVLIAEDEASTRLFLQHHLDKAGFRPLPAKNGREALSLLSDSVKVVLVDLTMPDLSGLECIRQMRRTHPGVEPIVVTASSEIGDAVEAMKCGAFDYITKPVNVDELIEAVRRASRTAELAEENLQLKEAIGQPYGETRSSAPRPRPAESSSSLRRSRRSTVRSWSPGKAVRVKVWSPG